MTYFLMFVLIQRHKRRHSKSATSSWPDKGNMPLDRRRLLGHVETIQLILGVTDKYHRCCTQCLLLHVSMVQIFSGLPGQLYLRLLKMMIVPLIACSVVCGKYCNSRLM